MNLEKIEAFLSQRVLPDLEASRGGYDKIHTLEVVDWLKKILKNNPNLKLDENVMVIAAYTHDWGYSDIFAEGKKMNFQLVEDAKKQHMIIGAKKVSMLLKDPFFDFLSDKQKQRCVHLVEVHDKKYEISEVEELVLMEADMLSSLQISEGKPVYDKESNEKFMHAMLTTRIPKFITNYSKKEAKKLIQLRNKFYDKK